MTGTLTIIVSGMIAAATGVSLTVTIAMIRMMRTDAGKRIDDLRAETRDAHAQIDSPGCQCVSACIT